MHGFVNWILEELAGYSLVLKQIIVRLPLHRLKRLVFGVQSRLNTLRVLVVIERLWTHVSLVSLVGNAFPTCVGDAPIAKLLSLRQAVDKDRGCCLGPLDGLRVTDHDEGVGEKFINGDSLGDVNDEAVSQEVATLLCYASWQTRCFCG